MRRVKRDVAILALRLALTFRKYFCMVPIHGFWIVAQQQDKEVVIEWYS